MQSINSYILDRENDSWFILGPIMAKTTPKKPTIVPKCKIDTTSNVGKQQPILNNEAAGKTYTDRNGEGKSAFQPMHEGNLHQIPIYGWKHTRDLSMKNVNDSGKQLPPLATWVQIGKIPLHETQDIFFSLRENERQWRMASGKCGSVHSTVVERVEWWAYSFLLPNVRFDSLVECGSG